MAIVSPEYLQLGGILSAVPSGDIEVVYARLREPGQSFESLVNTCVTGGNPFGLEALFAFQLEADPDKFNPLQASEQLAAAHTNYAAKLAEFGEADEAIAETIASCTETALRLRAAERPE